MVDNKGTTKRRITARLDESGSLVVDIIERPDETARVLEDALKELMEAKEKIVELLSENSRLSNRLRNEKSVSLSKEETIRALRETATKQGRAINGARHDLEDIAGSLFRQRDLKAKELRKVCDRCYSHAKRALDLIEWANK